MVASYLIQHIFFVLLISSVAVLGVAAQSGRPRARELGIAPGIFNPGSLNAITDVKGVKVGHTTLMAGEQVRTGVTAVLPHAGNLFQEKVPAAIYVANGFGKLVGYTQVRELGNIETPVLLTNTLSVPTVADGLIDYMLSLPGNEIIGSVNPIVGETNDGFLNDIRGRHVKKTHVLEAIKKASSGLVEEGSVGAGTGTSCMGYKGGIGTSSRILPKSHGGFTVGVLVQTNFAGILEINGAPVGKELGTYSFKEDLKSSDGSCMIVIATDAPLSSRSLKRVAKRAILGLGKTGSFMANGSGDYAIAFSTATEVRVMHNSKELRTTVTALTNEAMSPIFQAVKEATEEAIYNSLLKATTIVGKDGHRLEAIPVDKVIEICKKYNLLNR